MSSQEYTIRIAGKNDEQAWDTYVNAHSQGSPYHFWAWKNSIEQAYGHRGHYLLAENDGAVAGVLPLIHLHFPLLVNELVALPFCDVGNILSDNENVSALLLARAVELSRTLKVKKIDLRGNLNIPENKQEIFYPENTDKVRMFLDLPPSSDQLLQGFKSKLRSQIRKAEKNGLIFRWGTREDLDQYYEVFSINMRDLGSPVHSRQWFASILENFGNKVRMGIVDYEDKTVGCCIILLVGKTVAIPWASTLRTYNKLSPNMLLYWNILKYSADNGFSRFDFGRSSEGEGTYKFKKQWGTQPTPLPWYSNRPSVSKEAQNPEGSRSSVREKVATIWSRLPLPAANRLGPAIRKYISL